MMMTHDHVANERTRAAIAKSLQELPGCGSMGLVLGLFSMDPIDITTAWESSTVSMAKAEPNGRLSKKPCRLLAGGCPGGTVALVAIGAP